MANNLWNLRQGNIHASNPVLHPHRNNNSPIACRLCNQIFLSNQALLNHIDSHIAHEEDTLRTLTNPPLRQITSERGPLPNHFTPNIPMPMLMQEQHDGGARGFLPPPVQHTHPPLQNYSPARNTVTAARMDFPGSHFQLQMTEGSSRDGTKQYIKQLEKPIKSIEIIDLVEEHNDLQAMDLSLTL